MDTIFLLVEHGREQGEVYVLGWFDNERTAKDTAEAMEWKTYREEMKRQQQWSSREPLSPAETSHRRFWVKNIAKFGHSFPQKSAAVH